MGDKMKQLSDDLFHLQAKLNDGRGVSCVRTISAYLSVGNLVAAKAATCNEWDKIRNYPEIVKFMKDNNLAEAKWI